MLRDKIKTKSIAKTAIIGALYVALSLATLPLASGAIQVRIAEGLTILPLFFSEAVVGVFVGCLLTNLICGCAIIDIFFGSFITLLSAILTYSVSKILRNSVLRIIIGGIFPILLNALLLPIVWLYAYKLIEYAYIVQVGFLFVGETISIYGVGTIIYKGTEKFIKEFYND